MNINCYVQGGGIFSKLNEINNINIINKDDRIDLSINPFKYIYIQNEIITNLNINCVPIRAYHNIIPNEDLIKLKIVKSKLIINDNIIKKYNEIKNNLSLNASYLGVHIRLTDMNKIHPEHGIYSFNDYVNSINEEMKCNIYDKIFVASDNRESIFKLKKIYGNMIISYDDFLRVNGENDDISNLILSNFNNINFWEDTFIEMLLLSECGTLIHRVSNFANMTKIYANTINKIILL